MPEMTAEQLAQRAYDMGLLDAQQHERIWSELGTREATVEQMKSLLLRKELLTNWQLGRLEEGRRVGYFYGPYKILYLVGAGTFARVYRAVHTENGQVFAVKVLRKRYSDDMERMEQFMREARTVIPIRHPNIVQIFDVTSNRGQHWMIMAFVEGQNLREWLKRTDRLSIHDSLRMTIDISAGLDAAFKHGVTHRDMKNSNVLVSTTGRALIADFGLAGVDGEVTEKNVGEISNARSIDYAGLERATGVRSGDKRSDIFFVGCSLYHMLTGISPLLDTKDRAQRLAVSRYKEIKPISDIAPNIPVRLVMAVNRATEFDPEKRFQSPGEMLEELQQIKASIDPNSGQLKIAEKGSDDGRQGAAQAEIVERPRLEGESFCLMLVESNVALQDALRSRLKALGYKLLVISNPQRALDRFELDERPADCVMFGTSELGVAALEAFNNFASADNTKDLPAVLIVDQRQKAAVVKQAKLAEHRVVTTLPLKFKQLRATLIKLLAKKES